MSSYGSTPMDISEGPSPRTTWGSPPTVSQAACSGTSMKPDCEIRDPEKAFLDQDPEDESDPPDYSVTLIDTESTDSNDQSPTSSLKRSELEETEQYDELRRLGNGGNGNCFLLRRRRDNVLRVCKVCRSKPANINRMPAEAYILQTLLPPSERIVRMHETIMTPHTIQIYFDYYDGGDLNQLMSNSFKMGMRLEENFVWHCYQQLCEALAYIHTGYNASTQEYEQGVSWTPVIHGDIKPLNIFVKLSTRSCFPELVLGDFGNSQVRPGRSLIGTLPWMPPEVPEYSVQSDVWGVGAIIHAMCHEGKPPMRPFPSNWTRTRSALRDWELMPYTRHCTPLGPEYSSELNTCLELNMNWSPTERPTSNQLLVWVNEYVGERYRRFGDWHTVACEIPKSRASNPNPPVLFSVFSDDSSIGDEHFTMAQLGLGSQEHDYRVQHQNDGNLARSLEKICEHQELFPANRPLHPEPDQQPQYLGSLPDREVYWYLDAQGKWYTRNDELIQPKEDEDARLDDHQDNELEDDVSPVWLPYM